MKSFNGKRKMVENMPSIEAFTLDCQDFFLNEVNNGHSYDTYDVLGSD